MIIEMRKGATDEQISGVVKRVHELGFRCHRNEGTEKTVVAVFGGDTGSVETGAFEVLLGVERVFRIQRPYKLASRETRPDLTIVRIGNIRIGGKKLAIMAGPCAVESEDQINACAAAAKSLGVAILRGGAFKPRSSPFAFQGMGEEGLKLLRNAANNNGLLVVTEVISPETVELVAKYADILQVGARNMQNYQLLDALGKTHKPVLLKRGLSSTIDEWLQAADYILQHDGTPNVILCHRGVRTFDSSTRFTFDVGVLPVLRHLTHLPVITDPSHAAGNFRLVPSYAKMAVAGGADGLIVEIHPDPSKAKSDGAQSLTFSDFKRLMRELERVAEAVGRST